MSSVKSITEKTASKGWNIAYKRVSTIDQTTARQLAETGIVFDRVFEDKSSGKNSDRPELKKMLETIRAGDSIYVHSIDRLARNVKDLKEIVEEIKSKGASIRFVKENLFFSPDGAQDPMSNLMFHMLGAFAEFERQLILERQKEGIAKAKERGVYAGRKAVNRPLFEQTRKLIEGGMKTADAIKQTGIKPSTYFLYLKSEKENSKKL